MFLLKLFVLDMHKLLTAVKISLLWGQMDKDWIYCAISTMQQKFSAFFFFWCRTAGFSGWSVEEQQGSSKIPGYPNWPVVELLRNVPVVGVGLHDMPENRPPSNLN